MVSIKIKLHKALEFRNENKDNLNQDGTILQRVLGNVNEDTEITFEYTLKSLDKIIEMEDVDLENLKTLPFQTQITYKTLDGAKIVKVITQQLTICSDREDVEKDANYEILGQHAIQQSAKMAQKGDVREAQAYAKNWNRKIRMNNSE